MKGSITSIQSKKPKHHKAKKSKTAPKDSGTEDVYSIPNSRPKTVVMTREMKRRQAEECLRAKHGAKKDKKATIT